MDRTRLEPGARRFENWECYYAGKLGLAVAVDYARAVGIKRIEARNAELASQLRGELAKLGGVRLTDLGLRKSAIVTFTADGADPQKIGAELRARQINVSVSSANNALLDLAERDLKSVIRASVHYYNTAEEIERFCRVLSTLPA
jgi:cysteine desulfurase / selenocysteine lyase